MKYRALLTIIIAILTGFAIGYITSNQVRHLKTRDVRSMSSKKTFKERSMEIILPDEDQLEVLDPMLDKYAHMFDSLREVTSEQYKVFLEEFHSEIYPYLDDEQIARMNEFGKHWRKGKKNSHKEERND
jgi:ASC-1-like (ASCH) protein